MQYLTPLVRGCNVGFFSGHSLSNFLDQILFAKVLLYGTKCMMRRQYMAYFD